MSQQTRDMCKFVKNKMRTGLIGRSKATTAKTQGEKRESEDIHKNHNKLKTK